MIPIAVFAVASLLAVLLTAVALRRSRQAAEVHITDYWVDTITEAAAVAAHVDDGADQVARPMSASRRSDSAACGTANR